jgi:hypothetical protein
LSVVRGILEAHDGSIDASSRPGEGTTFAIRLPRIEPAGCLVSAGAADGRQTDSTAGELK